MDRHPPPPIALTIAGSDSGGGAGIQADLKTFQAFGVFGTSAITAVTAQNTTGVRAVHPVPVDVVRAQISAVAEDLRPAAVKSGMLATADLVRAVATSIREHALPHYVLDPVMVSTSGHRLLDAGSEQAMLALLVPLARLVTPNVPEAEILTGLRIRDDSDMASAAHALVDQGAEAALVTGGHGTGNTVLDVFWDGRESRVWRRPRLASPNTHGTGCTLSAAICAGLARGRSLVLAVENGIRYVDRGIRNAPGLGSGHGPLEFGAPGDGA